MLLRNITTILFVFILVIDLRYSQQVFALSLHHVSKTSTQMYARDEAVTEDCKSNISKDDVVIQKLDINDIEQIKQMSKFCIDTFYNHEEDDEDTSLLYRKLKSLKLALMEKAQLMDIQLSNDNRCIVVAKDGNFNDIIGVCEVIEDRLSIQPPSTTSALSEKERRIRTSRMRAVIENLCVRADYRKCGVGMYLVQACEEDVQSSWPGYDEVYTQVEVGNTKAYHLFQKCGYHLMFDDSTCTKIVLHDSTILPKEMIITKHLMRKILDTDDNGL